MKILYAASRNQNAKIQLSRFLTAMDGYHHQIKVAAYKTSSPAGVNIDWTLDALLNIYKPDLLSLENDNLEIYFQQIKSFAPDLIISDLEYFTSYVAGVLNIPLWQYSSSLINFALVSKYNLGLFKYYAHSLNRDPGHTQRTLNLIENSERNLIYSHFGDSERSPEVQEKFEWSRPYHQVARVSIPCQHRVVANLSSSGLSVIDALKNHTDSVVFMESDTEKYRNICVKNISNENEYYCNLKNSRLFICQGHTNSLADAFYNDKFSIVCPDFEDAECIINSQLSDKLQLGRIVPASYDINEFAEFKIDSQYKNSIKYLHEQIEEL
jgi:uncharacterized protein (TIGR00661 family)